ncbi:cyclopropane-fatty-acyl-phospholipid synthase [Thalassobaculum litoreum DSM 18839]|uniref:Cyclopropane-fatty-acyl-phospholipid synthase n=2 Tax=Thalassobaculaceae TaxID=2844864 RepID=A0A8G2BLB0_9PROT|nr:cyclopropane-fatty-acyl-phospholipid synthase [Thalassobaculum litoreum DSM 18839]
MLSARAFRQLISIGHLTLIDPDGNRHECLGSCDGPRATVRILDRSLDRRLMLNPELAIGEGYMNGGLVLEEESTLYDFLDLCMVNIGSVREGTMRKLLAGVRGIRAAIRNWNPVHLAQGKVAHHYDLSDELFDIFLDSDRQYSCAYFLNPDDDLETAQWNKKLHLAAKLNLKPGQRVLDIGSGWGGLSLFLASLVDDLQVDGVTLSREQHAVSNRRAEEAGVADRVRFHLKDYREVEDQYDRIVSVGMLEHVGPRHYDEFYGQVNRLLRPEGVAVVHAVGVFNRPEPQNQWMEKYIFPGAYTPSLRQQFTAIENTRLFTTDVEILRQHYAETLNRWRLRCAEEKDRIVAMYDERFYRMWEFYLTACETAFRHGSLMVFQIQLAKNLYAVPQTRDYIADFERRWRGRGATTLRQVAGSDMGRKPPLPDAPQETEEPRRA